MSPACPQKTSSFINVSPIYKNTSLDRKDLSYKSAVFFRCFILQNNFYFPLEKNRESVYIKRKCRAGLFRAANRPAPCCGRKQFNSKSPIIENDDKKRKIFRLRNRLSDPDDPGIRNHTGAAARSNNIHSRPRQRLHHHTA